MASVGNPDLEHQEHLKTDKQRQNKQTNTQTNISFWF